MKIQCLMVGKTEKMWKPLQSHYQERLKPFAPLQWTEVSSISVGGSQRKQAIMSEGERMRKHIGSEDYVIVLDERGDRYDSVKFAGLLKEIQENRSWKQVTFVIGGAFGLDQNQWTDARKNIRLSDMTMTHQMVRILLLEQVYRGFQILRGSEYHK